MMSFLHNEVRVSRFFVFVTLLGLSSILIYIQTTSTLKFRLTYTTRFFWGNTFQIIKHKNKRVFLNQSLSNKGMSKNSNTLRHQVVTSSTDEPTAGNQSSSASYLPRNHSQKTNINCSLWSIPKEKWKGSKNPVVVLDPKKFFYPGLRGGPNNQVTGIKEAVYLAIKLNRTLAIPFFTSHFTNNGKTLSPFQVLDVERLCSFVSCVSVHKLKTKCNGSFDVAFQGPGYDKKIIKLYEDQTKMSILQKPSDLKKLPFVSKLDLKRKFPVSSKSLNSSQRLSNHEFIEQYESPARCAVFLSLFLAVPKLSHPTILNKPANLNKSAIPKISDGVWIHTITDAVRHPPIVVQAAMNYIRDVFKTSIFIGIHWRFDKKDWANACKLPYNEGVRKFCEDVWKIKPSHLIEMIKRKYRTEKLDLKKIVVYMAAPPSADDFKSEFYDKLLSTDSVFVKPEINISSFIVKTYKPCLETDEGSSWYDNLASFVSLCEMELMAQSSWFYFSSHSTWSNIVRAIRRVESSSFKTNNNIVRFDGDVGTLALREIEKAVTE